jgi:hypothetical protein
MILCVELGGRSPPKGKATQELCCPVTRGPSQGLCPGHPSNANYWVGVTVIVIGLDLIVPPPASLGTARLTWIVYLPGRLKS